MDTPIRPIAIAEQARLAAKLAHDTLTEQPNPHEAKTAEAAQWNAAYCFYNLAFSAGECVEGSA